MKKFTEAEVTICMKLSENSAVGGFHHALIEAISRADLSNLRKIEHGFPELVEAYNAWIGGDLAERWNTARKEME